MAEKPLSSPNAGSTNRAAIQASPEQRLAILRLLEADAGQSTADDRRRGIYPSSVHTLPRLSAFDPGDKATIHQFVLAEGQSQEGAASERMIA